MKPAPIHHMSVWEALRRIWPHLRARRRWQVLILTVLAFVVSFAELATIGAVIPFLAALVSPEQLLQNDIIGPIAARFDITSPSQLLLPISVGFGVVGLLAALIRLVQIYANVRFAFGLITEIGTSLYRRTLYQPYLVHVGRNTSEIIAAISGKMPLVMNHVLLSAITMVGALLTIITIFAGLLIIDAGTTLIAFGGLALLYALVLRYTRSSLGGSSSEIASQATKVVQVMQEGLGGIRDVILGHTQEFHTEAYRSVDRRLRVAQSFNMLIAQAPRYLIEGLALCVLAALAYFMAARPGGVAMALPVLGALALGAQRLLPVMQLMYSSMVTIRGALDSMSDVIVLLDQPLPPYALLPPAEKMAFQHAVELTGIAFRYESDRTNVLQNLSLTIPKGQRVGIIGKTGSGKSTLADILMGLLPPQDGEMLVDGVVVAEDTRRSWQAGLSHVPQTIFLIDGTIAENIALATAGQAIDWVRVKAVAEQANIAAAIEAMPMGYETRVGERGIQLSGGQRQRIGIARALFKDAEVIILDEATSALDSQTEREVMAAIDGLDKNLTIIVVAHRLSTLRNCDIIYELDYGQIVRSGTYEDIVAPSEVRTH